MKKHDSSFFRIGEVTQILGVTRKALLNYEAMGLLTPAMKDAESGFRYYTADNMTQICSIRTLQSLGLSLKEVAEYYYDAKNAERYLRRLVELRTALDRNIRLLRVRSIHQGDLSIHRDILPGQVCFDRRYHCEDVGEAADALRETYIAAARTGQMSKTGRIFTMRLNPDPEILDIMCCVQMEESFEGAERMELPEVAALCIYYRGPYERMGDAVRELRRYVETHRVRTDGPFRSIYLEGLPNRGGHSEDYITQVAVPLKS